MKSRKQSRSSNQNLPTSLALAAIIILNGTIHAGPTAENPGVAFRSAIIEAVGGILQSVPPPWHAAIGDFLNVPSYRAANLRQAISALPEPTPQEAERARLDYGARGQGFPGMQDFVATRAAEFVAKLSNPTPQETAALTARVAELNAIMASHLPEEERKRQDELREKMERMAEALDRGLLVPGIAEAVKPPQPAIPLWQKILPESWRLRRYRHGDGSGVVTRRVDVPAPSNSQNAKMAAATSLGELKKFPIGENGQKLIEAMETDSFIVLNPHDQEIGSNPFYRLRTMEPIARILQRGIASITRTTYQSSQHAQAWNVGYDMVRYEIVHPDGAKSFIDAFRKSDNPYDHMMGGVDLRPTYHSILISDGNGQMTGYLYKNGELEQNGAISLQEGLTMAESFVSLSMKKGGLTQFENPKEISTPKPESPPR
ncbi:MAG: hypothetical protein HY921_01070 [Elusimicrobia bacterium]|nr:hypothetical protein [Elusimicrobiota bacterium]